MNVPLHRLRRTIEEVDWGVCLRYSGQGQATSCTTAVYNSLNVGSLNNFHGRELYQINFVPQGVDAGFGSIRWKRSQRSISLIVSENAGVDQLWSQAGNC